ncbi:TPA: glutamate-1-semialdehyde 2,1-aminomutase [Vibrio parahaemolyticus]|uniref:glutamate-1-semialdehyde 2,1-aminomutase n=1 Tax=Vibrio parahaemolyticus TaxID=670 RepID=UPI000A3AB9CE|nr:glutamate-1-semialdehyde 2,1-aminomutase [Vibrio parahaemolyticus]MDF4704721.1 glutamate-1-semialdehyde 2,1-aminomutase [Vibrio parahaemolyticus]OUD50658.1 glutamate-1-semialdehyde 2,1-aminomutase [Vibrio parahaemolyticus]HCE2221271.1 glutamate-1-semialdehyde 2,1-aminomutase [Vibrio parahaemolyticus]HCG7234700.1 glutamate-1-semialdehyde 2,1-aminomutase [Vibrio parahaemolyticus]
MSNYKERLLKAIPGGAHTYSRGYDQYPESAPQILSRGKGAYCYDDKGTEYLDYGMSLRAVNLGYANDEVDMAAFEQMRNGNNLTRASLIELQAAELLIDLIDSVDMVKFTKNGSTAVSAAVKLARAYTNRNLVARCAEHPFFSYDDWFIGSTPITKGIPEDTIKQTKMFSYNDINSLKALIEQHPDQFACVVLEPSTMDHPAPSVEVEGETYLHDVQRLCKKHGIVFILDEMITGFRWHIKGAQHYYNIQPDLCTFGKAMANGFSVAAVAGKREIMQLGSIEFAGSERLFLLSTTHGAEMCGLGAFVKTVEYIQKNDTIEHLWDYGQKLTDLMNRKAKEAGVESHFQAGGVPCSPWYMTYGPDGQADLAFRTLFSQEMLKNGVLIPWIALSHSHGEKELEMTEKALEAALNVYKKAIDAGSTEGYLKGDVIKPVFRSIN